MNRRSLLTIGISSLATLAFGAAAMAQTATPGTTPTTTAGATQTATVGATGTAVTGTATVAVTRTQVSLTPIAATVTPVAVSSSLYVAGGGPFNFAHSQFARTWIRTDLPVSLGRLERTWFWGPGPNTPGLLEPYKEDPSGRGLRLVQYFDKSRMEVNNPQGDVSQPFFVTNGLLSVELIGVYLQVGEDTFVPFHPACIPMTGDFQNTSAVTYAAFQSVSNTQAGDHFATSHVGQPVTATISAQGVVGTDASKASVAGVSVAQFITETRHNIPTVFWTFLNQSGPVVQTAPTLNDTGTVTQTKTTMANAPTTNQQLITPWFFASGYPVSEAYWTRAPINGVVRDVLVQAYQRRSLTYVPTNKPGFQVEMGNIGQHYFDWRYRNLGYCIGQPVITPTPPVPAGTPGAGTATPATTGTAVGTGTPGTTGTPRATTTAPAGATGTATPATTVSPVGTPVP